MAALASLPKHRVFACARCGRRRSADQMVFSTHTRLHYCGPRHLDACARRARKARR